MSNEPIKFSIKQTVSPTAEPIHRTEFKNHQRVDINDEDGVIDGYIAAARQALEVRYKFQACAATWRMRMDELQWYQDESGVQYIPLPRGPLLNVSSVTYVDTTGVTQTWSSTNCTVDTDDNRLVLAYGANWPSLRNQVGGLTINYRSGYVAPFTATTGDVLTIPATTYANTETVRLSNSGGTLPAGLSTLADYYVVGTTGQTIQLSTSSGGAAVDITDTGSGNNYVGELPYPIRVAISAMAAHLYENREPVNIGNIVKIPMHVDSMMATAWDGVLY